jgi:hypothetical protein
VLHLAPEVRGVLQPFLPPAEASFSTLLSAAHPAFAQTGVRVGSTLFTSWRAGSRR